MKKSRTPMQELFWAIILICCSIPLGCSIPLALGDNSLKNKKIIEWGWDEPDTKFIREHIGQMEQMPFDGLIFHVLNAQGKNLAWEIWGNHRFEMNDFQQALADLQATKFHRFTEVFLRVNVTPGDIDWFDDNTWAVVLHNFGVAAKIAKASGIKGFMFDSEPYLAQQKPESALWSYNILSTKSSSFSGKSYAEYQSKARQRGREWIQEINRWFPNITILMTSGYGYDITRYKSDPRWGLHTEFMNGIFNACSDKTTIVDAWEPAYDYKKLEQFKQAYDTIKVKTLGWTDSPEKYRQHIQAGFGIMMDYNWRKIPWNVSDVSKNYFSPAEFENSVRYALQTSDRYVWIYTEQPRWWTNEKLPKDYIEALIKARK